MAQPQVESTPNIPPTNFSWDDIKKTSCEVCDNITKNTEHYSKSLSSLIYLMKIDNFCIINSFQKGLYFQPCFNKC